MSNKDDKKTKNTRAKGQPIPSHVKRLRAPRSSAGIRPHAIGLIAFSAKTSMLSSNNTRHASPWKRTPAGYLFVEFPDDDELTDFDADDRMFAAVAAASANNPAICNAVDSDWCIFKEELEANGLTINNLCPDHIKTG